MFIHTLFIRWPFSLTDQSQTPFMMGLVDRLLLLHAKLRKSVVPGRALQWPYPPFGMYFLLLNCYSQ